MKLLGDADGIVSFHHGISNLRNTPTRRTRHERKRSDTTERLSRRARVDERFSGAIRLDAQRSIEPRAATSATSWFVDYAPARRTVEPTLTVLAARLRIRTEPAFNPIVHPWERSRTRVDAVEGRPAIHYPHATPMTHADAFREEDPWITQTLG